MFIKRLSVNDLYLLNNLFSYNDLDEMIHNNTKKIRTGDIDIFGLFSHKELIGEIRVMYTHADKRFAWKGKRAYLYAFRIHKDFQGMGLGKLLLRSVIDSLYDKGYSEMTVGVEDDNERAKYIYKSFGFDKIIARVQEEYQGEKYEYNLYLNSR